MKPLQFTNAGGFSAHEAQLYGRQMVLSEVGLKGQLGLRSSEVVLVGAGGLGSPAALYLACAGIGKLKIVDGDIVALTNLHRQVIHDLSKTGQNKALSAVLECVKRNDTIEIVPISSYLDFANAEQVLTSATVVVDATDNARSRYLINDVCAKLGKPLVSGSALRWEGQLSVFNFTRKVTDGSSVTGPCYRCVFPVPPILNNTGACDMEGVVGPAPGIIGVMEAMEAIKVCLGLDEAVLSGRMLLLDCLDPVRMWKSVQLRGKNSDCAACGLNKGSIDFEAESYACPDEVYPSLPAKLRISPQSFFENLLEIVQTKNCSNEGTLSQLQTRKSCQEHPQSIILDVRKKNHYATFSIGGTRNCPIDEFIEMIEAELESSGTGLSDHFRDFLGLTGDNLLGEARQYDRLDSSSSNVNQLPETVFYCLCRRGRDSSKATKLLNSLIELKSLKTVQCLNVDGGFMRLSKEVENLQNFPVI